MLGVRSGDQGKREDLLRRSDRKGCGTAAGGPVCREKAEAGGPSRWRLRWLCLALAGAGIGTGCNSEEIERLQRENQAARAEVRSVQTRLEDLQKDPALTGARDKLAFLTAQMQGLQARIHTTAGVIEVKFFPDKAPIQCFNFTTRAESGFYNGTQFHRVIKDFMIQGGDPNSKDTDPGNDGRGGPAVSVPHEFNEIKHTPGMLSTARTSVITQGAGSQFFIMHGTNPSLDGQYTVFGQVTKGMEVVDAIVSAEKDPNSREDRPLRPVTIRKIELFRH